VSDPDGAGLYLHVPFCASICPYCDFAVARGDERDRERFTAALVAEIDAAGRPGSATVDGSFDTIYLGGGTPSFLPPEELRALLGAARARLAIASDAFVMMEANPEDVTPQAAGAWRELGVGGLSLGTQSFDDAMLRFLGRGHRGYEARRAVEVALAAGFEWVSLDLIYGAPLPAGDAAALALADVATAVSLAPHHVSCYQLTVHDGTPFGVARARGRLRELVDDAQATLFFAVHESLAASGYPAYEVSNFARGREHRSRHNSKYWRHVPYLGLGPSAHSFDGTRRWWNVRDWREWASAVERGASGRAGGETLTPEELALEALMLGLRTADGFDLVAYRERYGVDLVATNGDRIERAVAERLLSITGSRLAPMTRGMAVAESLAASFDLEKKEAPADAGAS
jgi:oxygen-independent coproporphyrinogen-3 oxidase